MRLVAKAKINWTLDITGKRADGYHLLDTLMQQVALGDEITLEKDGELSLKAGQGSWVTLGPDNLVLKAAAALQAATGCTHGAEITLTKQIPIGAGMGGGSADAAAVLVGLNDLWELGLTQAELEAIGVTIGADVPYCIRGGLQRARGIGEEMIALSCKRCYWLVVVQPCRGLSTKQVFTSLNLDEIPPAHRPNTEKAIEALATGNLVQLGQSIGNVLQPVSQALRPAIGQAVDALKTNGAQAAIMTGSGSAVFGVFWNAQQARKAHANLRLRWPACFMTHTVNQDEA